MSIKLEQAIETYFDATNNQDPKRFISIFAEDAIVLDEGQVLVGLSFHYSKRIGEQARNFTCFK